LLKPFIEKSTQVHGNKYDYSLVNYVIDKTNVKIICREHGVFEQEDHQTIQMVKVVEVVGMIIDNLGITVIR
jgi:hypothetical protein